MTSPAPTTVLGPPRCPRCKDGYLGPDWEGLTCVNCGYNWTAVVPLDLPQTTDRGTERVRRREAQPGGTGR